MKVTFLGTGTSHGVPPLDCMINDHARCKKNVCRLSDHDPKHRRTRSSIIVELSGKTILIDASLDFRQQALREKVKRIDALLITHGHADHIGGIPDLRSYDWHRATPLPLYGSAESIATIRQTYGYVFDPMAFEGGGIPKIETRIVTSRFELFGDTITPIAVHHGVLSGCLGFRIGGLVYIPDMKSIADNELEMCRHADTLILNCLRDEREHISHLILPESVALARALSPRQCFFIHMSHDIHYEIDGAGLDDWMAFAWDGLQIQIID